MCAGNHDVNHARLATDGDELYLAIVAAVLLKAMTRIAPQPIGTALIAMTCTLQQGLHYIRSTSYSRPTSALKTHRVLKNPLVRPNRLLNLSTNFSVKAYVKTFANPTN